MQPISSFLTSVLLRFCDVSRFYDSIFHGEMLDILRALWHIIFKRGISVSSVLAFACGRVFFLNPDGLQILYMSAYGCIIFQEEQNELCK